MSFLEPEDDDLPGYDWFIPWHAYVPGVLLAAGMSAAWLFHSQNLSRGMVTWGISGEALAEGRYETIALHMFAHGPLFHILMNMWALVVIGPPLIARLGAPLMAWPRFLLIFLLSGLAGTALFLAMHPHGTVPMLGASGAIYGLLGLLLRLPREPGPLLSLRTPQMRGAAWALVKDNLFLIALLTLPNLLLGGQGGLAWEAHLGGFLFGLLAGPRFLPRAERVESASSEEEADLAEAAAASD